MILSNPELLDLGRRVADKPFRELTNTEMLAVRHADRHERLERIELEGCCGDKPMADGYCFGSSVVCPALVACRERRKVA